MSNVSFRIKLDKAELQELKMTVSSPAVAIAKFQFDMCDCMVHCDAGTDDFSVMLGA